MTLRNLGPDFAQSWELWLALCNLGPDFAQSWEVPLCGAVKQKSPAFSARLFCDPPGARTQDPNIKSVVLYLLS